nr:DUF1016 N-terminal domain-containing protein [Rhodopirellula sp. JC639]
MELYWFLGDQILEKQKSAKWGEGFLKTMSEDLLHEFPEIKGFSRRNLELIRQWFVFWNSASTPTVPGHSAANQIAKQPDSQMRPIAKQLVSQIPWGHNIVLMQKLDVPADVLFYVQKTIENNWSRAVLTHQIESGLHLREGQAIHNFEATLPKPESDLARQLLRDPYNFDFLTLTDRHNERCWKTA